MCELEILYENRMLSKGDGMNPILLSHIIENPTASDDLSDSAEM